jgi:hypothetical protein
MEDKVVLVNIGSPRDYAYFTDLELNVGDWVSCPMGKDNKVHKARVSNINPTPEESRFASKRIIEKITQEV